MCSGPSFFNNRYDTCMLTTKEKYLFDTLLLDDEVLDIYINNIRPLFNPKCNYLLFNNNGNQYAAFTSAMSILLHEAIGK